MKTAAILLTTVLSATALLHAGEKSAPASDGKKDDATLFPIPNLTGSFQERERLLGDVFGARQSLAEHGVQLDFNMTHTFQSVLDGGESQGWSQRVSDSVEDGVKDLLTRALIRLEDSNTALGRALAQPIASRGNITLGEVLQNRIDQLDLGTPQPRHLDDSEYQGTWRMELKLDSAKMGLWPGGFAFMRVEQNYGTGIGARAGTVIPPNFNAVVPAPGLDAVTIPHLYIAQFLSAHVAIVAGKLDITGGDANEFAHIQRDDRFVGVGLGINPVLLPTIPYSPLGASLLVLPTKDLVINLVALDGDGTPTRSGFDTMWDGKTSYNLEGRLTTHFGGKTGHQLLGGVYGHGRYAEFDQPLRAYIPSSGVKKTTSNDTWSVYWNFDQYLWNPTIASDSKGGSVVDPTRGIGIFARVGIADETTNPIAQFYSAGVGGHGLGSARKNDRWGLGWYYMKTSRDLPDFLHLGDENGFEGFYDFAVTPAFLVTADLQVTDSAKEGIATAVIGGLRATMRF